MRTLFFYISLLFFFSCSIEHLDLDNTVNESAVSLRDAGPDDTNCDCCPTSIVPEIDIPISGTLGAYWLTFNINGSFCKDEAKNWRIIATVIDQCNSRVSLPICAAITNTPKNCDRESAAILGHSDLIQFDVNGHIETLECLGFNCTSAQCFIVRMELEYSYDPGVPWFDSCESEQEWFNCGEITHQVTALPTYPIGTPGCPSCG